MAKAKTISETDLYRPVHDYLVRQGYTVRAEVKSCDIAAVRGDDLIVIELKRAINITLLAQAVERQKITDSVYVAVPRPSNMRRWNGQTKSLQALLRRLEIGLILVSTSLSKPPVSRDLSEAQRNGSPETSRRPSPVSRDLSGAERNGNPETARKPLVQILFHPLPPERRKRKSAHRAVLTEINGRSADFNEGGSCRRKLVTAYRENAIQIACCLRERGPLSPKDLRALGTGEKTLSILYTNVYSWFDRVGRGLYALSAKGREEMGAYGELVEHYSALASDSPREQAR